MIRKNIDVNNILIKSKHFPSFIAENGERKALLGLGGNVGDTLRRFEHLYWFFKRSPFVHIVETSPILQNPPFGYTKQEDFFNALMLIETRLTPKSLLKYVLYVERLFGRKRSFQDAPRTLDIDIIFYENVKMQSKTLILPHHGWKERSSVLIPLSYMKKGII